MIDPFGRTVSYLRVSVTDRCDFRCVYCMPEHMTFLPKADVLSLEELDRLCGAFIRKGVNKLRLTGGEPLVRRDVMKLFRSIGRHLQTGSLKELTLTTNGSQLARFAPELAECGVNDEEIPELISWAHGRGMDMTLIETMPMGDVDADRTEQYLPLSLVKAQLAKHFTMDSLDDRTGGPARYVRVRETGGRLGFITPLSHNFCESCNRVRLTCTGMLYMCLGQDDSADLRAPLRASSDDAVIDAAIDEAIGRKPKGHDFIIDRRHNRPAVARQMSLTGG